jgi:hypothetical protein
MKKIIIIITMIFFNSANAQQLGDLWEDEKPEEKPEELTTTENIRQNVYDLIIPDIADMFEATTGLILNVKAQKERDRLAKEFKKNTKDFVERWDKMTGTEKDLFIKNKQIKKENELKKSFEEERERWAKTKILREKRGNIIPKFTGAVYELTIKPIITVFAYLVGTSILIQFIFIAFGSLIGKQKETEVEYKSTNNYYEDYKTAESNRYKSNAERYKRNKR